MKRTYRFSFSLFLLIFYQANSKSLSNSRSQSIAPSGIKGPPVLTEFSDRIISVQARNNVDIKCPIAGDPPSMYDWFKGPNETERLDDSWERFYLSPNDPHLKIRSVTHEDSGNYTCKAVNGFGQMYSRIQLLVIGDDPVKDNLLKTGKKGFNGTYTEPEILLDLLPREKVVKLSIGDNLLLTCEAKGNPRPDINWFKGSQFITGSSDGKSVLKLTNLSESSNGKYKCEARNKLGPSKYEVDIEVTGSWLGKAEILGLKPTNLTLFPGESGNITCVARFESQSHPTFAWVKKLSKRPESGSEENIFFHDGNYYKVVSLPEWNEKEKYVFTTDLILRNVSRGDTGKYLCVVYGSMGFIHSQAQVYVQNDPAQAQNIRLNKEREVTVQWVVLWASAFLVVAILVVTCFVRLHGCRGQLKRVPVLRTPVPKKSPGETVSTTLTHPNEVGQGLADDNMTLMSGNSVRMDRNMRCSSGLSESDVTDVMISSRRAHGSRRKSNIHSSVPVHSYDDSYHFLPRTQRTRKEHHYSQPKPYGKVRRYKNGNRRSRSSYRKYPESDFSDMDLFPPSVSTQHLPQAQVPQRFSCSSSSLASSNEDALRGFRYGTQHYFQPPSSPVSSYRKQFDFDQ